jgi:hypothetical protein
VVVGEGATVRLLCHGDLHHVVIGLVLSFCQHRLLLLAAVPTRGLRAPVLRGPDSRTRRLPRRVERHRRVRCRRSRRRRDPGDRTDCLRDGANAAHPRRNRAPLHIAGRCRRLRRDVWARPYRRAVRRLARGLRDCRRCPCRRHGLVAHVAVAPVTCRSSGRLRSGVVSFGGRPGSRPSMWCNFRV